MMGYLGGGSRMVVKSDILKKVSMIFSIASLGNLIAHC